MRWQRRARFLIASFLVGLASLLFLAIQRRAVPGPPPPASRTDPRAATETTPGTITLESGDTVAFERLLTYADGRAVARDVTATLHERDARQIRIRGREAWQHAPPASRVGRLIVRGDVTARTSDDFVLRAAEMQYDDQTAVITVPDRVDFEQGGVRGSSHGARYDRRQERLELLGSARVRLVSDAGNRVEAEATSAEFLRREHTIRADGGVRVAEAERTMAAATGVFHLSPDDTRLVAIELNGGASVHPAAGAAPAAGALAEMAAARIDLRYAEDGRTLQHAHLAGGARLAFAAAAGGSGRRVQASAIDVDLGPDGRSVTLLLARGDVRLDVPGEADRPAQAVRAAALEAHGTEVDGLRTATFTGGVEFEEASAGRSARASRLTVTLEPRGGGVALAEFAGSVVFSDGTWRAAAPLARYDPTRAELALGVTTSTESRPRLSGPRLGIDADRIELALGDERVKAEGRVRSVLRARGAAESAEGAARMQLPTILDGARPVYATAAQLSHDGSGATTVYAGSVRLWQGASVLRGDRLVLDERRGNLEVSGGAHAELPLADRDAETRRLVGEGERLEYEEATATMRYSGAAHVDGPAGDLRAGRIEVGLSEGGRELVHVAASDAVTLRLGSDHVATADHLTYLAATARYRLEGRPVRLREEKGGRCRETTGVVLTFTRSADTITVDGTDGNRSRTGPVACAERRL